LKMQGMVAVERRALAREWLERVEMAELAARYPHQLSEGQGQRVALARALAPAPKLLMLDEPLGSLDRTLRERLMVELHELFEARDITALFVTHDQDEAFALAERVIVMRAGRVEQAGEPQEVWTRPATEFTARFLGFDNIVDAQVAVAHFGEPRARSEWGVFPVPADTPAGAARLALRPDALRLDAHGPLCGVVETRTFRRDHFLLRIALASGAAAEVAVEPDALPEIGSTVRLSVDPDGLVVLPPPHANGQAPS
jgi:thiamine transport system ATP-binding protein